MSLVVVGDPHGDWRPLLDAVADDTPAVVVILGGCDLGRPLHVERAPEFAAGAEVACLYGNQEKDLRELWDNLVGDHLGGLLHATVRRLGPYYVAGLAGVFKQRIWLPPAAPVFESRATFVRQLAHFERWRGGLPLRQREAIFPEDILHRRQETHPLRPIVTATIRAGYARIGIYYRLLPKRRVFAQPRFRNARFVLGRTGPHEVASVAAALPDLPDARETLLALATRRRVKLGLWAPTTGEMKAELISWRGMS